MRRILLIAAVSLLAAFAAACSGEKKAPGTEESAKQEAPAFGDALVEGSIGDVSGFLTAVTSDSASHAAANYMFNGLVRYDKDLKLEGDLAESWEVTPDGKKITFRLRKNVKWHDNVPFTSADVVFTYRKMIDPDTPTAYGEAFRQVRRVTAPDAHTVIAEYDKPYAPALESWGLSILPKHLLEKYKDIKQSPLNTSRPIGTGPYKFVEWKPGEKIVFDANPDYYEGKPYLSRVVTRIIPDQATMFLELKSGGIDQMTLTPLQFSKQTDTEEFRKNFRKHRYLSFVYIYLGFRLDHPFFTDRRVRHAISHAINKKELIDGVLFGLGQEVTGPYKPGHWVYNPDVKIFPYDPPKAKGLLAEAGWKAGADGTLQKDGKKFAFTVLTNAGNESRAKTAAIIQQQLAAIGIKMEIRTLEWAAFINEFVKKRKFDALILGWSTGPEPDQFDIWSSTKTGPDELNHVGFKNPEVDRLLEEGRRTFDMEKRKKAYFRFQEILAEEQPYVFLYAPETLPVFHKRFRGIKPEAAGIGYNFIKWYVPKPEQKYTYYQ